MPLNAEIHSAVGPGNLEEVWFPIEKDEDGYPASRSWEGLWAHPAEQGFEIVSIPFYLRNVSSGDLVAAVNDGFLRFTNVIGRGGHNTYRLLVSGAPGRVVHDVAAELGSKGLATEINETGLLIAVDVPPTLDQDAIDAYLISGTRAGRWEMQDGFLNTVQPD